MAHLNLPPRRFSLYYLLALGALGRAGAEHHSRDLSIAALQAGDPVSFGHTHAASERQQGNASDGGNNVTTRPYMRMNKDLTCFRFSGGTCSVFECHADRGPTQCVNGYCVCQPGYCASVEGICERGRGSRLGKFAIRFTDAAEGGRPYMGVDEYNRPATLAVPGPQWNLALTHDGFVRFESLRNPGQVLTIYQNRRRRSRRRTEDGMRRRSLFLQETASSRQFREQDSKQYNAANSTRNATRSSPVNATKMAPGSEEPNALAANAAGAEGTSFSNWSDISDDRDLWPRMKDIGLCEPLESNFLVHSVWGGLEIWDPQTGVALATVDSEGWDQYDVERYGHGQAGRQNGLAECRPKSKSIFGWGAGCHSRKFVEFKPGFPGEAVSGMGRVTITQMSNLNLWQFLLVMLCMLCCCGCCFGIVALGSSPELIENLGK